jgi:glycosyltransferase involved in cell wall biosynthesis
MSTKDPFVSIIVPTFCEEKNIEWCLRSLKSQRFDANNTEIIVVDSDSSDDTRAIAKRYADKVINIKERGVSKARNVGAQAAKGEILLFLDADTILDTRFVDEMCRSFTDSKVVCLTGSLAGLENLGMFDNVFRFFHYTLLNQVASFTAHLGFPFFPTVCCACRKSLFHQKGGFDEGLAIAEDLVFSLKMGRAGKCLVNKQAKAYTSLRRIKKNGRMKNYLLYFRNYFKVFILNQKPWIHDFPHTAEI